MSFTRMLLTSTSPRCRYDIPYVHPLCLATGRTPLLLPLSSRLPRLRDSAIIIIVMPHAQVYPTVPYTSCRRARRLITLTPRLTAPALQARATPLWQPCTALHCTARSAVPCARLARFEPERAAKSKVQSLHVAHGRAGLARDGALAWLYSIVSAVQY